jgi:hypothetical protein
MQRQGAGCLVKILLRRPNLNDPQASVKKSFNHLALLVGDKSTVGTSLRTVFEQRSS